MEQCDQICVPNRHAGTQAHRTGFIWAKKKIPEFKQTWRRVKKREPEFRQGTPVPWLSLRNAWLSMMKKIRRFGEFLSRLHGTSGRLSRPFRLKNLKKITYLRHSGGSPERSTGSLFCPARAVYPNFRRALPMFNLSPFLSSVKNLKIP
jgi:hypothetical protein